MISLDQAARRRNQRARIAGRRAVRAAAQRPVGIIFGIGVVMGVPVGMPPRRLAGARGTTTLMVPHDDRVLPLADRIVTLRGGRIVPGRA